MKIKLCLSLLIFTLPVLAKNITGGVYVATNYEKENSIVGYKQYDDGTLEKIGEFGTGGKGTGLVELFGLPHDNTGHTFTDGIDPLASAYPLWRSADNRFVLIANAGDGTVSSMQVQPDLTLRRVSVVKAGHIKPNAIATYKDLVYVASLGVDTGDPGDGNIKGYHIDKKGVLTAMPDSIRLLGGRPASLEFTGDGKFLLAVEITTGVIHVWSVNEKGALSHDPVSSIVSPQLTKDRFFALPIGTKIIDRQDGNYTLLVTETRFLTPDHKFNPVSAENKKKYPFLPLFEGQSGSVTSYNIDKQGKLSVISPDVISGKGMWGGQQAVCWITASPDGKFAWTTNPLTASISTYKVNADGSIALSQEIAWQAKDLKEYYLDMDLSADGKYVNTISGNTGKTWVFKFNPDNGELTLVNSYPGSAKIHSYGIVTIPYQKVHQAASEATSY